MHLAHSFGAFRAFTRTPVVVDLSCNKISTLETIYTEADRSNVRAPSISLRAVADPIAVASPKKSEVNINAQWVDSSALSKSVPFGQIIKVCNMGPPVPLSCAARATACALLAAL